MALSITAASSAHAGGLVRVEAYGIELEVPTGWSKTTQAKQTMLAPRTFKGRAIQLVPLATMPAATPDGVSTLLGSERLEVTRVGEVTRHRAKLVVAEARLAAANGPVDVDLLAIPTQTGAVLVVSYIRADQDPVVRQANAQVLLSARASGPRMTVTYVPPKTPGLVGAPRAFVTAFEQLVPKLDALVRWPGPLPVKFEECGQPNAFYSPADHSIRICHELFDYLVQTFTAAGADPASAARRTSGTVLWTFFHELGHALVGELELGITGRGEDAADELATLVIASARSHQSALDAAAWFHIESKKPKPSKFWDAHSMDGQRVVTIACLLYGADPAKFAPLLKTLGVPASRAAKCTRDYPARRKAWEQLLAPHREKPLLR
ncbi:MAG TPA: DUF4344 domain-containing metallopeptidase [Kofleriaceae bacterium]|nr:DUF4344 domain-containing metallopeptidase [Kofleriaceae bacterium]